MTTIESPMVRRLWDAIHTELPQTEFGGSVPNLETEQPYSYHRSWEDSKHDDGYSVHYYGDKHELHGLTEYACALDVTLRDHSDMIKYTARLHHLAVSRGPLKWAYGLREFAGTVDGVNTFGWDTTRNARTYGWDATHLFHIHLSFNRRFVNDDRILRLASIFKG